MATRKLHIEHKQTKLCALLDTIGGEQLARWMAHYGVPGVSIAVVTTIRLAISHGNGELWLDASG